LDYTFLGKRIREERLRLNLTQEHLAEEINISTAYLGQIERGERHITLDKLIPLAERPGVSGRKARRIGGLPTVRLYPPE